jgi:hypothetical protein
MVWETTTVLRRQARYSAAAQATLILRSSGMNGNE